ncbi:hypothetical protein [uncultured Methylobacterium sp.]|uniref:hypothetical protein n=1 Tax=uncultured Methylobacterium sp. TaxID=157278 RepID=UPI0035CAA621
MEGDFKRLTIEEVRALLRASVSEAGGQKAWAGANSVSETTVCEVLRGTRQPGPRVLGPLGLLRMEPSYALNPFGASASEARA